MNNEFEPKSISDNFLDITGVSHPSGKEDPIRELVIEKVKAIQGKYCDNRSKVNVVFYEPEATDPGKRIILLRREGANSYAGKVPIILQAHLDMVTVPSENIFPLKFYTYTEDCNTWLKAVLDESDPAKDGTTLGADDGIGVATILSALEDETLKDVPLECLFTVQEETDMGGAKNFDASLLTGKKYLNLDAEDLNIIIYGSAGGCSSTYKKQVEYRSEKLQDYNTYKVTVQGLKSGHSGVDINKCRLNAIKVVASALGRLDCRLNNITDSGSINSYDILLHRITRMDIVKMNSIPAYAEAVVSVPANCADSFVNDLKALLELIKSGSQPVENGFIYSIAAISAEEAATPMTEAFGDALLGILNTLPHGVIKMIPSNAAVVETSTNLFDVRIDAGYITIGSSNRSSSQSSLDCLNNIQQNIGNCFDYATVTNIDPYPAWQPNDSSEVLGAAYSVYQGIYGDRAEKTVIHAGLECSWIVQKFDGNIDCISIGPTIQNPHTENERLLTASSGTSTVELFYNALKEIIFKLL